MFIAAGRMFLAFLLAKRVFVSSPSCPLWVTIKRKENISGLQARLRADNR